MVKARVAAHLDFQKHHRELRATGFSAARALPGPEHAIAAVVQLFELKGFKAIKTIAVIFGIQTQAGGLTTAIRQQCPDQVWCALKNAVVPAVGMKTVLGAG
jgi:DUF1009 family protein